MNVAEHLRGRPEALLRLLCFILVRRGLSADVESNNCCHLLVGRSPTELSYPRRRGGQRIEPPLVLTLVDCPCPGRTRESLR